MVVIVNFIHFIFQVVGLALLFAITSYVITRLIAVAWYRTRYEYKRQEYDDLDWYNQQKEEEDELTLTDDQDKIVEPADARRD